MRKYSPAEKAKIVAQIFSGEKTMEAISRDEGIPVRNIKRWKSEALPLIIPPGQRSGTKTKSATNRDRTGSNYAPESDGSDADEASEIELLIIRFMESSLAANLATHELSKDPAWFMRQTAGDIAILEGVRTDKTIRLFELICRARELAERARTQQLPSE